MSLQARKVPRLTAYGFEIGKDFCSKTSESAGGRPAIAICDYDLTSSDPTVIFGSAYYAL